MGKSQRNSRRRRARDPRPETRVTENFSPRDDEQARDLLLAYFMKMRIEGTVRASRAQERQRQASVLAHRIPVATPPLKLH